MNILLIGPQGSGKGTQARLLVEKYGFFYFEAGDFLRNIAKNDEKIAQIIKSGALIPDDQMCEMTFKYLESKRVFDKVIFDGFPRNIDQFKCIEKWLAKNNQSIDLVFVLEIPEDETVKRLSSRRLDTLTGKIYNTITDPAPANIPVQRLIHRDDDKPQAIVKRLEIYHQRSMPLIKLLEDSGKVVKIDGMKTIEEIHTAINNVLQKYLPN